MPPITVPPIEQRPVTLRPARPTDADAVVRLCRDALADAADPTDADTESLRRVLWNDVQPHLGYVALAGDEVIGAAYGTPTPHEEGAAAVSLIAVAAPWRRRGSGGQLLERLEGRLQSLGATGIWSGGGQPRFWWPGVDRRETGVLRFFEAEGYEEADFAPNLTVDLAAADLGPRGTGAVGIRRLTAADWPEFLAWMNHTWEDPWGAETATTLDRTPIACFVAELGGRFVGFAAYDSNRPGWFGPMGSSPEARGTGIGSELLRACLRDYVNLGRTRCEIGWVGPAAFYAKTVGAVPGREFARLRKALPG